MAASAPVVIASDQSAVPVSGTVTANIGTSGSLALDATLTGGTQQAQIKSGLKGASAAALVTSTANGVDHQGLDVVEAFAPIFEDNSNGIAAVMWKPLNVSTYCPTLYSNFAGSVTGAAIKSSAGNLFTIVATNANIAVRYLQLHNATAKPAGGATPIMSFPIPITGSVQLGEQFFTLAGIRFSTGITWAISTTVATFTDSATASDHTVHSAYI